ncbi:hypothetical protein JXA84_02985 [candidate division WOR-3 bacterium]|nr:hypothetical protein [candidate division WOR-3 bacterium]
MIYGIIALCAGSYSNIPQDIELTSFYKNFISINRGLVLSLGLFFIVSGIFILLKRKWALSLIFSASVFRIFLLVISLVITLLMINSPSFSPEPDMKPGTSDWIVLYIMLAAVFVIEISVPIIFLFLSSLKRVKDFFDSPKNDASKGIG